MNVSLSFLVEAMEETGNVKSSPCLQWEANLSCVGAQGAAPCQPWGLGPHPASCQPSQCGTGGLAPSLCLGESFSQRG